VNLDLDSAQYNPKTRALVNAGSADDKSAQLYAEEGFTRASGDAAEFETAQKYAWETQEKMGDTTQHIQANPTAGEFYRKKQREEEEKQRTEREKALLDRYGGEEHIKMPEALKAISAVTASETFVEYDESGAIKGAPQTVARSKYPEDIYINNHASVWGSWWSDGNWGYACCHSFVKNSYCTGEAGKKALEAAEKHRSAAGLTADQEHEEDQEDGEGDPEKISEAKKRVPKKRTAMEMIDGVTEEDLDNYRRKRAAANDPMANLLGKDELVTE
jgi:pre-mRNA-processing factor SLU7